MSLLDIAHTIFSAQSFGSDFLIELVLLVILLHFIDIVGDLAKGRGFK